MSQSAHMTWKMCGMFRGGSARYSENPLKNSRFTLMGWVQPRKLLKYGYHRYPPGLKFLEITQPYTASIRVKMSKRKALPKNGCIFLHAFRSWRAVACSLPVYPFRIQLAVCQNLVPLVNIKIAGKWMFIPLKMVLIGIDPYPIHSEIPWDRRWFFIRFSPTLWILQNFSHWILDDSWWSLTPTISQPQVPPMPPAISSRPASSIAASVAVAPSLTSTGGRWWWESPHWKRKAQRPAFWRDKWENLGEEWLYPILMIDNQTTISKILVNLLKII